MRGRGAAAWVRGGDEVGVSQEQLVERREASPAGVEHVGDASDAVRRPAQHLGLLGRAGAPPPRRRVQNRVEHERQLQ